MKKRFLPLLCGFFAAQFLLAQNPPVEPPSTPSPTEKKPAKVEIKKAENTVDETVSEPPAVPAPPPPVSVNKDEIFPYHPLEFEFTNGEGAMLKFIYDNLKYPKIAKWRRVQGTVLVKFVIEKNGAINDAAILQDIGVGCGAEALRIVKMMPLWTGASSRGRPERWEFIVPIEFRLKYWKPVRPKEINLASKLISTNRYYRFFTENKDYKFVTHPPSFHGCEGRENYAERDICTEEKLLQFIKDNLKYPGKAKKKKIEGLVYVTFSITENGSIYNAKLMNDIGEGCGAEALRVVNNMPKWNPGKLGGRLISSKYNLPIVFSLK